MTFTTAHLTLSLDGFVAGPDQTLENPMGRGAMGLHEWHFAADQPGHDVDRRWTDRLLAPRGAYLMGRNMFGPVRGEWSTLPDWRGWWGEEPPYHAPVVVLTHHAHPPVEMAGGTTFFFATDGFAAGLQQAREAGDGDVDIAGGASVVQQALRAGELDELTLDLVPVLLGAGERLLDDVAGPTLEQVEVEHSPWATHLRYRVSR